MRSYLALFLVVSASVLLSRAALAAEPINIGFLWHMHQPIYIPGETIGQTDANGHFSFSVTDVHNQRFGPYTSWPKNAIDAGLGLSHLGAQVSFSGSLMENLNNLEAANTNGGMWNNWDSSYRSAANYDTTLGNARLDLVGFGYHHPLMPLLDDRDIRMQIKLHKLAHEQTWGPNVPYSKGIFPAETAFSTRMIPALVAEGLEWAIVDNIHFDRATQNYPHTNSSNLYAPNRADQVNPDPTANGGDWVQLNNLWAPSQVSAPFSYTPNNVQHVDPATGQIIKMVAVPAARYEGNEDGRGGFGALQYEQVMSQYLQYNTDPDRPMFVLLHHDGDNFGGGSESYYHGNFQNMVNWASSNSNYDVTTIQDYLDRFPVPNDEVIHIEPGSWAGADNGDPEFKKWLGDPDPSGWSPDRNSWAVLTAAKNRVYTADDMAPYASLSNIQSGSGTPTERGWHYLLQAQASDHWYWDGAEVWDSNVTRGSNLAAAQADTVIDAFAGQETTPPTVFLPQRESYNPGGFEFGATPEPSDFEVWTYAYDVSGLSDVKLKYRIDNDGFNPLTSTDNETYAGGAEVGAWTSIAMQSSDIAPPTGILAATYRAERYAAQIVGHEDVLIDYYVEAIDELGNVTRSDIQHVYVGAAITGGSDGGVLLSPDPAMAGQLAELVYDPAGAALASSEQVHAYYGFDSWSTGITQTSMLWDAVDEVWKLDVTMLNSAELFDVVFNDGNGTWDNNKGQDWHFAVEGGASTVEFVMDGQLDSTAQLLASGGSQELHAVVEGNKLYIATNDAGEGYDVFVYLADEPGELVEANWAKNGQVAAWDAFLADENDNDYREWFDHSGATQAGTGANGGVLEGVIDLVDEFGAIPDDIYLAVALFDSADGGSLISAFQVAGNGDGDGNVDAAEYVRLVLRQTLTGDFNADGVVNLADYTLWRDNFGATITLPGEHSTPGVVTPEDYLDWKANYGARFSDPYAVSEPLQAVPEPNALLLLLLGAALLGIRIAWCSYLPLGMSMS